MEIITQTRSPKGRSALARLFSATPEQARDTGLALTLVCLLLVYFWDFQRLLPVAMGLLVLTMAWPRAFRPLAGLWFGLAHLLGTIMSTVILTILFFGLVTPIGLFRRLWGADTLQLKKWKKGQESVFVVRADLIRKEHLRTPY